ncbi:MAG: CGGC domain-containing protein [Clostridiales bacterium]|nr:CGGC domain-containing protein [Clostridiales bacterium]MCF8023092.1 CGGC domain-containing protein [Clostridiales bacterium]
MNIAILACKNIKDDCSIGCHHCLLAFDKREGDFVLYEGKDARIMAIFHCGGCPGSCVVARLMNLKAWMARTGENIDALHIGTCLLENCPYKDSIIEKVKANSGVEVVEGSHSYRPDKIFAC